MQQLNTNLVQHAKIKLVCVAVAAVLLASCKFVGPDYQRPLLPLPAQYGEVANQAATEVSNTWWTLYQDQTLNDLITNALQNNTDIKLSVARIEEADAVMQEVGAALFPQVDLNMNSSRSRVTSVGANPAL
ncbi:MAG: hypothetical protein RIS87_371, partial [Pseudomonadota bacterium]